MNKMFSITASLFVFFIAAVPVYSSMPAPDTTFSYNVERKICQYNKLDGKVLNEEAENLIGDYWSIRECRRSHPEVMFYQARGIFIWFGIIVLSFLLQFFVYPNFNKKTLAEKKVGFMCDIFCIGILLFFHILLWHYFDIHQNFYPYPSDIDHIIYSLFLYKKYPQIYLFGFIIFSTLRGVMTHRLRRVQ